MVGTVGTVKVDCAKCFKLIGYNTYDMAGSRTEPIKVVEPTRKETRQGHQEHQERQESAARWLYVSKRLDLLEVPNTAPWRVLAFTYGRESPVAFYRVTPQVVVWLDSCGVMIERKVLAGESPRSTLDDYLRHMDEIWRFASLNLDVEKVRAARMEPASLPPVHGGPI